MLPAIQVFYAYARRKAVIFPQGGLIFANPALCVPSWQENAYRLRCAFQPFPAFSGKRDTIRLPCAVCPESVSQNPSHRLPLAVR